MYIYKTIDSEKNKTVQEVKWGPQKYCLIKKSGRYEYLAAIKIVTYKQHQTRKDDLRT